MGLFPLTDEDRAERMAKRFAKIQKYLTDKGGGVLDDATMGALCELIDMVARDSEKYGQTLDGVRMDFMGKECEVDQENKFSRFIEDDPFEPFSCPACLGEGSLSLEIEIMLPGDEEEKPTYFKDSMTRPCPFCDWNGAFVLREGSGQLEPHDAGSM